MKNQTTKFTCGVDAVTLVVSVSKGKSDIRVRAQQREAMADGKTKVSRVQPEYFDLEAADQALRAYGVLVTSAKTKGWVEVARSERSSELSEIPSAPGGKVKK